MDHGWHVRKLKEKQKCSMVGHDMMPIAGVGLQGLEGSQVKHVRT